MIADGELAGLIETQSLAQIPREEWERHTVGEVMRRDLEALTISPEADALEGLSKMQQSGSSRLLVIEGNRLVGILSLKDLLQFLNLKLELEDIDESRPEPGPSRPETERPISNDVFARLH